MWLYRLASGSIAIASYMDKLEYEVHLELQLR